jgi:hypothetical protein
MNNSLSAKLSPKKPLPLIAAVLVILFSSGCGSGGSALSGVPVPNATTTPTGNTSATGGGADPTTPPPATTTSGLPTPPADATVFSNIDETTDNWADCSDCAGGAVTSDYWSAPFRTTPSLDGSSREFYVGGPAWADVLWYKRFGAHNSASHFLWDFWVYFDTDSAANVWSAEYDIFQSIAGQEFMIGSQCVFGEGSWNTWDSLHFKWITIPVPCPRFAPNTWHHIVWYVERIGSNQYRYNTLVVDDKSYTINQTFTTNPIDWADVLGVQWQLDVGGKGGAVHEWVDKTKFTIW